MTGPIGLHIALQIHQSLFHGVHIRISRILAGIHGGGPDCGVIFVFQRHHASILGVPQSRPTGDLVSDHICIVEQRGGAPDPWHTDDAAVAVLYLVNAAEVLSQVVVVLQLTGVNGFQNTGIQILLQIQGVDADHVNFAGTTVFQNGQQFGDGTDEVMLHLTVILFRKGSCAII